MKLSDLVKNVSNMSEEELLAHVQHIRHNKYVAKPAVAKRAAEVEKKEVHHRAAKVSDLIDSMTDDQKAELIKQLGG